jgi:hypothetical protein
MNFTTALRHWIVVLHYELALLKYRNPACILCYKVKADYKLLNPPYGYGRREVRVCEDCWPEWLAHGGMNENHD